MRPHPMTRSILILGLLISPAEAQSPATAEARRYKVAFWYDLERPWSTAQYRAYDLAKGQYDEAAVARWQRTILEKYPRTGCCVRDLTTSGEPGATEAERLTSAVEREKQRWAALNKGPSSPLPKLANLSARSRSKDKDIGRASFDHPAPGSPGPVTNPPTSPYPYPYRSGPR
jgi:hypothetical protein